MLGCKYKASFKCENCKYTLYRECKKFIVAHAKEVSQPLQPFVFSSKYKPKGSVMWSKDVNRAKSLALQCAIKTHKHLKRYSLSQIISLALQGEYVEDNVVYIDCSTKVNGDIEKLKGVVVSFIEASLLNNAIFVIYVAPTVQLSFDFERI